MKEGIRPSRRALLASGIASIAGMKGVACKAPPDQEPMPTPQQAVVPSPTKVVDIHCHAFNEKGRASITPSRQHARDVDAR